GVPGVGPKTAVRWLEQFPSLEELLQQAGEMTGKAAERLRAHGEQVLLSKRLATIVTDVPLTVDWERLRRRPLDRARLASLWQRLEFRSLLALLEQTGSPGEAEEGTGTLAGEGHGKAPVTGGSS